MITKLELNELTASIFTGITMGVGSLVLLFSSGASILVQCPFRCEKEACVQFGHGEDILTSTLLFPYLNIKVQFAKMLDGEMIKIFLLNGCKVIIMPEVNDLDSYVISTQYGDYPLIF